MAEPVSLSPGSDNPPDQEQGPFTEEDVHRGAAAIHAAWCPDRPPIEPAAEDEIDAARAVLRALAEAGRLLPAGTPEITEQWSIKRGGVYYPTIGEHPARSSVRAFGGTLLRQIVRSWPDGSQWIGPWEVVE